MHKRLVSFFFASLLVIFFTSCHDYQKNSSHASTPDASIKEGRKLAAKYCASCHLLPDPSLLDSKSWENGVLPQMGPRLGIFYYGDKQYPSYVRDKNVGNNLIIKTMATVSPEPVRFRSKVKMAMLLNQSPICEMKRPSIRLRKSRFCLRSPI